MNARLDAADTVVQATGVSVSFGDTKALRGANFEAAAGEIHAIVGENGSGKSTLAKSIAGVVRPDNGSITVLNDSCTSPRDARRLGLAMVFQEVLVAASASVVDNVYLGFDPIFRREISEREKADRTASLLSRLTTTDVDPYAEVGALPLDIRQWIVVARALIRDPKVLVLDEATAALDRAGSQRLLDEMRTLRDNGSTVLIVTHRIAELTSYADRATVLRDGETRGVLAGSEIEEHQLLRLMSGDDHIDLNPAPAEVAAAQVHDDGQILLSGSGLQVEPNSTAFDFALREGQVLGIAGLDGQGQATFVRALAGMADMAAGTLEVHTGSTRRITDATVAADAGIAFVSGDRKRDGLFANLSIAENFDVGLYRRYSKASLIEFKKIGNLFTDEVQKLSIKIGRPSNPIDSLSGGNQQKVLIGRALATNPRVIVLNDPARGVDINTKNELHRYLRQIANDGAAVVYLSSELEEFPHLCDRVAVFRDQAIAEWIEIDGIVPSNILRAMFATKPSTSEMVMEGQS